MRILFDATNVKPGQGGIRTYALGMATGLAAQPDVEVDVLVLADDEENWDGCTVIRSSLSSQKSAEQRIIWREINIPKFEAERGADVLFVPSPEAAHRSRIPQAVVVHDVGPLIAPALYGWTRFFRYMLTLRKTCATADLIICVSEATRLDLIRTINPAREKIHVVREGAQWTEPASLQIGDNIGSTGPGSYALYVGSALYHKNLKVLVDAYRQGPAGMPDRLVMVGPEYAQEVHNLRIYGEGATSFEHRGFLSRDDLKKLYSEASIVLLPSLHEGFGIPLVEAMQAGVPVVASNIPALREVGGDAPVYVNSPTDQASWKDAIVQICEDQAECHRRAKLGIEESLKHTWTQPVESMASLLSGISSRS